MTDAWISHVKNIQNFYKAQGTPISYNQALVLGKKTWEQAKAGEKIEMKVEQSLPAHNTRPRTKAPPKEILKESPTVPVVKKKSKKVKPLEYSSSEEEIKPKRKVKKLVYEEEEPPKRSKKRVEYISESSSESEEEVVYVKKVKKRERF
jgi:hypothetical protein